MPTEVKNPCGEINVQGIKVRVSAGVSQFPPGAHGRDPNRVGVRLGGRSDGPVGPSGRVGWRRSWTGALAREQHGKPWGSESAVHSEIRKGSRGLSLRAQEPSLAESEQMPGPKVASRAASGSRALSSLCQACLPLQARDSVLSPKLAFEHRSGTKVHDPR